MEGKTESGAPADRYLAHLGHELRTPLGAIIGYADALRARVFGPLDDRYADYAEIIHEAGRHMLTMAEDLLARASIGDEVFATQRETFDAGEPVAWALRLMRLEAEAAGVMLKYAAPATPVAVVADRRAISQMVINLVANALRFTPSGGTVGVNLDEHEGALRLTVTDTGVGMAPDSETGGRGLRLVRGFAQAHGGEMTIEGAPNAGTAVTLRLPVLDRPR
jgi:cell cycle sensor histidine kinase DivJ